MLILSIRNSTLESFFLISWLIGLVIWEYFKENTCFLSLAQWHLNSLVCNMWFLRGLHLLSILISSSPTSYTLHSKSKWNFYCFCSFNVFTSSWHSFCQNCIWIYLYISEFLDFILLTPCWDNFSYYLTSQIVLTLPSLVLFCPMSTSIVAIIIKFYNYLFWYFSS